MLKKVGAVIGAAVLVAGIIGTYHAFNAYVAKAADMQQIQQALEGLNKRIDQNVDMDRARDLDYWIRELKRECAPGCPPGVEMEIERLK
ncbi:MAG: hypothetical protein KJ888_20475, partial [Gammaproteobacteria bacterium]|nr:hypothetical protein [Gammaproteobacteria bacterium]